MVEAQMLGADPSEFADTLDSQFAASFAGWQQGGVQVDAWAWEGQQHAIDTAYGALPVKIGLEPAGVTMKTCADDNNIGDRMLHKHIVVGAAYQDTAQSVIEERLAQAGIRLAPMLEPDGSRAPEYMGLQFQLPDRADVLTASGVAITRDNQTVGVRFTSLPFTAARISSQLVNRVQLANRVQPAADSVLAASR